MKKRIIIISLLVLIGLLLLKFLYTRKKAEISSPSQQPIATSTLPASPEKKLVAPVGVQNAPAAGQPAQDNLLANLVSAVTKPIQFSGLVIDQSGNPIEGATVKYSANNRLDVVDAGGSRGETISGVDGKFTVNASGLGIHVAVSKVGYYQVYENDDVRASARGFSNQERPGKSAHPIPSSDTPAVFLLRKIGNALPLKELTRRSIPVAKDGTPTEISLTSGKKTAIGKGDLRVEAWTSDQTPDAQGHYDWRCRVTVPGGGLVERSGRFAFEAPADGYVQTVDLGATANQPNWRGDAERQFFVRLADNRYARIQFRMMARGDHFFVIESALNPEVGSRNLEAALPSEPVAATP